MAEISVLPNSNMQFLSLMSQLRSMSTILMGLIYNEANNTASARTKHKTSNLTLHFLYTTYDNITHKNNSIFERMASPQVEAITTIFQGN